MGTSNNPLWIFNEVIFCHYEKTKRNIICLYDGFFDEVRAKKDKLKHRMRLLEVPLYVVNKI